MNRPSSAFGLLLGFLALTMFAVSSTTRSTTVKPAANHADRAAIRRQAVLSQQSALAVPVENVTAGSSFDDEGLCLPDSIESIYADAACAKSVEENEDLPKLQSGATIHLTPVQIETIRSDYSALIVFDARTYDAAYDFAVLGISDTIRPIVSTNDNDKVRELSANDVATVFQSIVKEKSSRSGNAKSKWQRRASLEGIRSLADGLTRIL